MVGAERMRGAKGGGYIMAAPSTKSIGAVC